VVVGGVYAGQREIEIPITDPDADSMAEQLIDDPNVFSALRQQVINEIGDNY
jgi:hypothetical protein